MRVERQHTVEDPRSPRGGRGARRRTSDRHVAPVAALGVRQACELPRDQTSEGNPRAYSAPRARRRVHAPIIGGSSTAAAGGRGCGFAHVRRADRRAPQRRAIGVAGSAISERTYVPDPHSISKPARSPSRHTCSKRYVHGPLGRLELLAPPCARRRARPRPSLPSAAAGAGAPRRWAVAAGRAARGPCARPVPRCRPCSSSRRAGRRPRSAFAAPSARSELSSRARRGSAATPSRRDRACPRVPSSRPRARGERRRRRRVR